MDDFSVPSTSDGYGIEASPHNHVSPGKRPVSSMSPTVVVNKNKDVRMVRIIFLPFKMLIFGT